MISRIKKQNKQKTQKPNQKKKIEQMVATRAWGTGEMLFKGTYLQLVYKEALEI